MRSLSLDDSLGQSRLPKNTAPFVLDLKRRRIGFSKEHRKAMSDVSPSVTPERILQSVWAFAPPLAIEAAIRHRVFDVLTSKSLSLPELEQGDERFLEWTDFRSEHAG
jgi:hypothetical protein